eukprot:jgi/Chrzof1/1469/Cz10g09020.t1
MLQAISAPNACTCSCMHEQAQSSADCKARGHTQAAYRQLTSWPLPPHRPTLHNNTVRSHLIPAGSSAPSCSSMALSSFQILLHAQTVMLKAISAPNAW